MMTDDAANLNTKLSDRPSRQRQCVTASGETIFFIYPNGNIAFEITASDDGAMTLADQSMIGER